jgi:hypothetical protein
LTVVPCVLDRATAFDRDYRILEDTLTAQAVNGPTYPRQRVFGLFLCVVAAAVLLAIAFPYQGQPNGALFGLCYAVAFLGVMMNPFVRRWMGGGPSSRVQQNWSNVGLGVLAAGCAGSFLLLASNNRALWLALLLSVGVHFLFFVPVHGRLVGVLGLLVAANAAAGLVLGGIPLGVFFVVDGAVKLVAGVLYLRPGVARVSV